MPKLTGPRLAAMAKEYVAAPPSDGTLGALAVALLLAWASARAQDPLARLREREGPSQRLGG